jgi:hypothetical protein
MARSRGTRFPALAAAALLASAVLAAGCGESDPADPVLERGPAPPAGTLVATDATLRKGDGYTSLAAATNRAPGTGRALIVGLSVVKRGTPQLRLLVEGDPVPSDDAVFSGGGGDVAAVYCSCDLPVGSSEVTLEGRSKGGAVLGARSLVTFTPANPEDIAGSDLVDAVGVTPERTGINPSGTVMATTELRSSTDQVLLLAAYRSPEESSSSPAAIRTEALLNGEAMTAVANATMPRGKLVVFFSEGDFAAGDQIELLGFTVTGSAHVHVTSMAVCPCGLD